MDDFFDDSNEQIVSRFELSVEDFPHEQGFAAAKAQAWLARIPRHRVDARGPRNSRSKCNLRIQLIRRSPFKLNKHEQVVLTHAPAAW